MSIQLGKRTVDALLDRAPRGLPEQIAAAVARVPSVHRVKNLRVRGVGNRAFVDLSILVPRHLSFEESHAVTCAVQDSAYAVSPNADVVVQAVPIAEDEGSLERVQAIAARGHFAVHNITAHITKRGIWIDLDLEVDSTLALQRAHERATDLESQLRKEFGKVEWDGHPNLVADINVHIEPRFEELPESRETSPLDSKTYINEIQSVRRELPRVLSTQDIQLQILNGKVYLSFHCPSQKPHTLGICCKSRCR